MELKMNRFMPAVCGIAVFAAVLSLCCPVRTASAAESADIKETQEIHLNADKVTYSDENGVANAEGNVRINNAGFALSAPFAEYNTKEGTIKAFADSRNNVVITSREGRISGKHLVYNTGTKNGVLTNAAGRYEAFYIKGSSLKVMPLESAMKTGLVPRRYVPKKNVASGDQLVAEWSDVSTTTCDFTLPHYRLVTEEIIVIPDMRTIVKHPKLYLGKRMVFRYPFDFIIPMGDKKARKAALMPLLGYDSKKGVGIGVTGPIDLGRYGGLDLSATYWTNGIWEGKLGYEKELYDGLTLFAATERLYNKDDEDTLWRPKYGFRYEKNGWLASLYASERELVEEQLTPGRDYRFNVYRKPELIVRTPWYKNTARGWKIRFGGMYGRYQDEYTVGDQWFKRYALGAELYGEPNIKLSIFTPYYGARYTYYGYNDKDDLTQKVTDAWLGLKWGIGSFDLDTYYFRRWVSGESPMVWDSFLDNEAIYQTVSFPLPFGQSWEKWRFSVRAGYDIEDSSLAEMLYMLTYDKHCMTWQLWAKDRRSEGNFEMGLSFFIDAYPDSKVTLGSDYNDDKAGFLTKKTEGFFRGAQKGDIEE